MNAGWLFNTLAGALLLPPLSLILLCALGIGLRRRYPRIGLALAITALVVLAVLSTRIGARLLFSPLEQLNAPMTSPTGAQAIVVLGSSRITDAPEFGGQDIPSLQAIARLRYAARLHRVTGLPILLTGGSPEGRDESEAALMARALQEDYAISAKWLEQQSNNTAENAVRSHRILEAAGIGRILLVTDAMHMQRARLVFTQAGFDVVAAPTLFNHRNAVTPADFVPSGDGIRLSAYAAHEWLGLLWYGVRY